MIDITTLSGMREATRLTRAGQLNEAVATIQRTLQGAPGTNPAAEAPGTATQTAQRLRISEHGIGTHIHAPRRPFLGSEGRRKPAPTAESHEGAATPPLFGAGRHEQWRRKWHGFGGPMPRPEPFPAHTPDTIPDGGRFVSGTYTNHAGTRSYKLYIPSGYHGQPLPLVVMLHGCTQTPDDFAAGTRMNVLAEEHQCFVAYPAQSPAANSSKCWNWFESADQQRDQGEPSIIAGITRQITGSYPIDRRRIYLAGLSAGGAMAVTLAMTYPDLYAAVGVHSGLPYAVAQDLPSAFSAMHSGQATPAGWHTAGAPSAQPCAVPVPAIVFHGDSDTTVHPNNGDQVIAQWTLSHGQQATPSEGGATPHMRVQRGQVPHGHAYTRTTYNNASGQPVVEHWLVHGAGHAWSGGSSRGTYTDPQGPDASQEMLRFFYDHPQGEVR
ncbi:MAG: hypothetical protein VR64_07655 [Desulfatitalea sp. BRH_c12]|nr:MAG: hypothetical protein VR64_07655 [Desulfatitalea sp. BRH_c12]